MSRKKTYEDLAERGNATLDRIRYNKLKVTQEMLRPRRYLTTSAKKIFKEICTHIIEHNILCTVDGFMISVLAQNIDLYESMVKKIMEKEKKEPGTGYFQTFQTGVRQKSPEVQLMDKAFDKIKDLCKEYGLTVKSRDGMLAFSNAPTDDEGNQGEDELNLD